MNQLKVAAPPFPGETYPAASVTGMASAVKPLRTAMRTLEPGNLTVEVAC